MPRYRTKWSVSGELNGQSLEYLEKLYLGDTAGAEGDAVDSVMNQISIGWSNFRDLVPLLGSRGLYLGAKGRLYSAYVLVLCYMEVRLLS